VDPQVKALIDVVQLLVLKVGTLTEKVDGLLCHFTSIDADYGRVKNTLFDHEERIQRLEKTNNLEPMNKIGEDSALFPAIGRKP
jgi:hypothetical protein